METVLILIYIIDLILIVVSLINVIRVNQYLNTRNEQLNELIETKETNTKLILENYEYQYTLDTIEKIIFQKGQGSIVDRFDKIKDVIQYANKNNI